MTACCTRSRIRGRERGRDQARGPQWAGPFRVVGSGRGAFAAFFRNTLRVDIDGVRTVLRARSRVLISWRRWRLPERALRLPPERRGTRRRMELRLERVRKANATPRSCRRSSVRERSMRSRSRDPSRRPRSQVCSCTRSRPRCKPSSPARRRGRFVRAHSLRSRFLFWLNLFSPGSILVTTPGCRQCVYFSWAN